jgi:hypothetical protein
LSAKALDSILVTEEGSENVTIAKELFEKAPLPILMTEEGIVTLVSLLLEKAENPMLVTEEGAVNVTIDSLLLAKAAIPILITEEGIITPVS